MTKPRSPSESKHVNLNRGQSEAELLAKKDEERKKVCPFAFELEAKTLSKTLGLKPDSSTVELNNKGKTVAPFNYKD